MDDAVEHAECLRETVGELAIGAGNKTIRVTCSIGAAEWEPGDTIDSLLRRADIALYEAERSVTIALSLPPSFQWATSTNSGAASLAWPHVDRMNASTVRLRILSYKVLAERCHMRALLHQVGGLSRRTEHQGLKQTSRSLRRRWSLCRNGASLAVGCAAFGSSN